jgi:hypothetical protein
MPDFVVAPRELITFLIECDSNWRYFIRCRSASAAMKPNAFQPAPETIFSNTWRALAVSPTTK